MPVRNLLHACIYFFTNLTYFECCVVQVNLFNTSAYFSRDAELAIQPGTLQGECGASQPVCERQAGCGVYAEPYDSDRTCISFNVTEFSLSGSTGALGAEMLCGGVISSRAVYTR